MFEYFRETIQEMKLVKWPSVRHVQWFTVIVILVTFLVAYYLGFFDWLFGEGLKMLVA